MKIHLKCLECILHSFFNLLNEFNVDENVQKQMTRKFLVYLSTVDFELSPPEIGRYTHNMIKKILNTKDPYFDLKKIHNKQILDKYDFFYKKINHTDNPVKSALTLSIAGNIIDMSPNHNLSMEETIKNALKQNLKIDDSDILIKDLKQGKSVLYLADNAGEIVFDKLLLQILLEKKIIKKEQIIVAVRGYPTINDATIEDAKDIGLINMVKVIDNGDDAPGTILETTSNEFKNIFDKSELIIAKGQGNFECLNLVKNKNIYFMFIVKCKLIGDEIGTSIGDLICKKTVTIHLNKKCNNYNVSGLT